MLHFLEKAIERTAGGTRAEDGRRPVAVSLSGLRLGSVCLILNLSPTVVEAAARLKRAVATGDYANIPAAAVRELASLSELVVKRGWRAEIEGLTRGKAVVSAENPVRPSEPRRYVGRTTVLAAVQSAGGVTPLATVRLVPGGRVVRVTGSQTIIKTLAGKLYETVRIDGRATWDAETDEVVALAADAVRPGPSGDPLAALRILAETTRSDWDGVDADEFVRQLRGED